MIPSKQPIPPAQQPAPPRAKLEIMLMNGADFVPTVQSYIEKWQLPYYIEENPAPLDSRFQFILKNRFSQGETFLQKFITEHPPTLHMKKQAALMAPSEHAVLIVGETGTGKELIAKSMIGSRTGSIKAVNCAGFPEQLIESELFGHVKGAFTGAETTKEGLMSAASGGVMFLDEIGEMPLPVQAKLLRALQDKFIRKVGSNKEEGIDCKFVFATNRDLRKMVEQGSFRKDLYARISTLELHIESLLPDRKCDLIPIVSSLSGGKEFLAKYQAELMNGLLDLSFNVRSLQQHTIRFNVLGEVSLNTKSV